MIWPVIPQADLAQAWLPSNHNPPLPPVGAPLPAAGAKVGICEMPYNPIASDEAGGAGGTCVLRGCVPKKLFVYASEYREAFSDAEGFGCAQQGT